MDKEHEALARRYVDGMTPAIRGSFASADGALGELMRLLDWRLVMAPCVPVIAEALTTDELRQAIAWQESELYAKMLVIQPKIMAAVESGMTALLAGLK